MDNGQNGGFERRRRWNVPDSGCSRLFRDGSSEQQDVRFGLVDHVVDPAPGLLYSDRTPFRFRH